MRSVKGFERSFGSLAGFTTHQLRRCSLLALSDRLDGLKNARQSHITATASGRLEAKVDDLFDQCSALTSG
jgi:hypothetical protein